MLLDAIIQALLGLFYDTYNSQLLTSVQDVTTTPASFFGKSDGSDWNQLLTQCSVVLMPLAFTILCFCLAMDLIQTYDKHNGNIDMEVLSFTALKYVIPFLLISNTYKLMSAFVTLVNGFLVKLGDPSSMGSVAFSGTKQEFIDSIMNNLDKTTDGEFAFIIELMLWVLVIKILGLIIYVIVVGRLFEMALLWIISPIPIAFIINSEERQVGMNFFKQFLAILLQGFLMVICLALYKLIAGNAISQVGSGQYAFWGALCITAVLVFALFKTGSISKRILNTF